MGKKFEKDVVLSMPIMAFLGTVVGVKPRVAPVWFIWEKECLWMLGDKLGASVKRITDNPECAVEIVHFQATEGVLLHLGMRGKATVEYSDKARFKRLLKKYLGEDEVSWNDWFIDNVARIEDENGRMIKLSPESVFTNNVSYFKTGPDLAWEM
jgi:hypothetical protein